LGDWARDHVDEIESNRLRYDLARDTGFDGKVRAVG